MSLRLFPSFVTGIGRFASVRPAVRCFRAAFALPTFTPSAAAFIPVSGTVSSLHTASRSLAQCNLGKPAAGHIARSWRPASLTDTFVRRAFSSSATSQANRPINFPRRTPRSPHVPWWTKVRASIDGLPIMAVVYGLIAINVAVFCLWQYAAASYKRFGDPALYAWMTKNFILNQANVMSGRIWTLITSSFSHAKGDHIFFNCLGLYFMAPLAASVIGPAAFIGLYLAGGLFSAVCSLAYQRFGPRHNVNGSEGASGAIYTCLSFYATLFPTQTFLFFMIVPMPAWLMVGGIFSWDLFSAFNRPGSRTDSAGHMGGIIAGVFAAVLLKRRLRTGRRTW